MKRDASLAEELGHIRENVKSYRERGFWTQEEANTLIAALLAAMRLAQHLELELDIYRRDEDGQRGRVVCEQLAGDAIGDLLDTGNNVVFGDFGRRK
ncbi:MAG: hypothetical protein DI589_25530 [Shinella sp.]|nr:MAG: hypothetical protein DI589_25530 [Shinella sp.]